MTRRTGSSRTTRSSSEEEGPGERPVDDRLPSLRQRSPVAYWVAILCVAALVLGTVATALGAIL